LTKTSVESVVTERRARRRGVWLSALVAVLVMALAGGGFVVMRLAGSLPAPQVVPALPQAYVIPGTPPVLPWPDAGQAVVEVEGIGTLGSSGGSGPVPIASIAKVMTAYLILRDHPMSPGEDGPTLTVTADEADAYAGQLASGQSLVEVRGGEQLTERQALVALLLPSANNIAYILARWDAGSQAAFVTRMNQAAARLGMTNTRYTDPSGLDPATVSAAADQVALARTAMAVPALAQIVAMPQATLPVAGLVHNVNTLLGQDGIVGIKTGSTDQAGGCLLFAADMLVEGRKTRVIGAVLGSGPSMQDAFAASSRLIQVSSTVPHRYRAVRAGQLVATVQGAMGRRTQLVAAGDLDVVGWPGLSYRLDARTSVRDRLAAAAGVGTLSLSAAGTAVSTTTAAVSTAVRTTDAMLPPSWWERTSHW
jgi:D-alanyl-D-alanine carboxypeptidase (penicillin-binding protein 5/6)